MGRVLVDVQDLCMAAGGRVHVDTAFGVTFQAGALWSSMTVGENVMLPLELFTTLPPAERRRWPASSSRWWGWVMPSTPSRLRCRAA